MSSLRPTTTRPSTPSSSWSHPSGSSSFILWLGLPGVSSRTCSTWFCWCLAISCYPGARHAQPGIAVGVRPDSFWEYFILTWGYGAFCEGIFNGQTWEKP